MAKRVLIVGAGVIGLTTAYYAARKGHSVTVLDRNGPDAQGCSFGNAGMIVPSHFIPLAAPGMVALGLRWMWNPRSPFYIKPRWDLELLDWAWKFSRASNARHVERSAPLLRDLHIASRVCFEELSALPATDFGLVRKGLLMLCKTTHALDEEARAAEQARRLGIPAEVLDRKQTAAHDPEIQMDVAGSVYFPMDCHLTPGRFMAALRSHLIERNVRFLAPAHVDGWRAAGARIEAACTETAEFAADEYVLCGGSWSSRTAAELDLRLPLQAGKGYSLTLPKPRRLPALCAILTAARVAVTPMGTALRFGGTMELSGLNEEIAPARVQGIIRSIPSYYPEFQEQDFDGVQPWRGLRPCSPDGMPYVGRTARYKNLSIATGHAMMGLSLGPITGKLMSEILSGENPSIDIGLLNPDRYRR